MFIEPDKLRWLDYEYLNRTVVWEQISNFFVFVLPMFNSLRMVNLFKKMFLFTTLLGPLMMSLESQEDKILSCRICGAETPTLPIVLE